MNIALIRGINVGGHKKIAMADLREMFESLGFSNVKSLLQSGNLIFDGGGRRTGAAAERVLEEAARQRLPLNADFFVRTAAEWNAIVAANPFARRPRSIRPPRPHVPERCAGQSRHKSIAVGHRWA
jgi:uncharacterized protein (DUF1697 family)